ncbi:MAG: matrixin family metalloprotease [Phycisphaerales bacterium]|nr:MAG: matrixin family metalloprotease [Phycisphaerales bacterium]
MKTRILIVVFVCCLVVSAVWAGLIPANDKAKERGRADNAPVIEKIDDHWVLMPSGLERIVFIHRPKPREAPRARPDKPVKPPKPPKDVQCYELMAAKWKDLPADLTIDPEFSGLTDGDVVAAISAGATEWDSWTAAGLFGSTQVVEDGSWDTATPDGRNEMVFADYDDPGVIAVTIIWGYFTGRPSNRRIIEFDILFDTDFNWGDAGETNETELGDTTVMDLWNIATHEVGHGLGLSDLYESTCTEVTMYGYSQNGETKKRTLDQADKTGIQELYGAP